MRLYDSDGDVGEEEEDPNLFLKRKPSSQCFSAPRGSSDSPTALEGGRVAGSTSGGPLALVEKEAIDVESSSSSSDGSLEDDLLIVNELLHGSVCGRRVDVGGSPLNNDPIPSGREGSPPSDDLNPARDERSSSNNEPVPTSKVA